MFLTFFPISKNIINVEKSFNTSDKRGYTFSSYARRSFEEVINIPGTTVIVFEKSSKYDHSCHFFHFLEHLLGVWNFGAEEVQQKVNLFILAGNGMTIPYNWRGVN